MLARASHGTPREALRLYRRTKDFAGAHVRAEDRAQDARTVLAQLGVDERGFGPAHRKAVACVRRLGRVGASRLAALIDVSKRSFRELIEPELLRA